MTTDIGPKLDLRRERGARTRRAILERAASLASTEGLEGLSIGRLAEHLGISKSGLYAHFESKEELQLATIETASELYLRDIVEPSLRAGAGRTRLLHFADLFLDYVRNGPFPGGCFFIASALDAATQRGRVREMLSEAQRQLLSTFEDWIRDAQQLDGVTTTVSAEELSFEYDAILVGADLNFVLFRDPRFLERGRRSVRRLLASQPQQTPHPASS